MKILRSTWRSHGRNRRNLTGAALKSRHFRPVLYFSLTSWLSVNNLESIPPVHPVALTTVRHSWIPTQTQIRTLQAPRTHSQQYASLKEWTQSENSTSPRTRQTPKRSSSTQSETLHQRSRNSPDQSLPWRPPFKMDKRSETTASSSSPPSPQLHPNPIRSKPTSPNIWLRRWSPRSQNQIQTTRTHPQTSHYD
jgi:hypothetical protein